MTLNATTSAFEASLCWLSPQPLRVDAPYLIQHTTRRVRAIVTGSHQARAGWVEHEIVHRTGVALQLGNQAAGRIMHIDLATGKILGAMESPGHWLNVSSTGDIYIGSLTGNVFRWYPGWLTKGLGSTEGLRPSN